MATYEISDSVSKRHYKQHLAAGGAPIADTLTRSGASSGATPLHGIATPQSGSAAIQGATKSSVAANTDNATGGSQTSANNSGGGLWKKIIPVVVILAVIWLAIKLIN